MVRKVCATCTHWKPIIGYALGQCTDIPYSKIWNEDKTINRANCTRPFEVCSDYQIKKNPFYG